MSDVRELTDSEWDEVVRLLLFFGVRPSRLSRGLLAEAVN